MHIPKLLAVVCMAALGASSLNAQRADTDVQAKAREKLREAMAQADSQQGTVPAIKAPAPAQPAPIITSTPPAAPPPAVIAPTPAPAFAPTAPGTLSPAAEEKAREQLRQAAAQLEAQQQGQQPATLTVKPTPIAPAPVIPEKPKPVVKVKVETPPAKPVVVKTVKPAKVAATQPAPEPKKKPKVSQPIAVIPAPTAFAPMTPAAGSKEQRLNDLLQLYKTDKITPTEYHEQRAKILSGQ